MRLEKQDLTLRDGARGGAMPALLMLLAFFFPGAALGAEVSVSGDLDPSSIMVGETAALRIVIENGVPQQIPPAPRVAGLNIRYAGPRQEVQIVNGVQTQRIVLQYAVNSEQPGSYTIPAMQVPVAGRSFAISPLTLTVTENDTAGKHAFLRLIVPKTQVYVGEMFPVEIQLYVTNAEDIQTPQLRAEGFVIGKQAPHTRTQRQIGNMIYNVISFQMSVSAAKAGSLPLGPAESSLTLLIPSSRQRGADMFEWFANARATRQPAQLQSDPVQMTVLPLPGGAPRGFNGAVGSYSMDALASPLELRAGDPITLRISVSGQGAIEALSLPEFNWPGFKIYPSTARVDLTNPLGTQGTKIFEQVVIPETAAVTEIPPIEFSYFDPAARAYRTLSRPATGISVKPGAASQAPAAAEGAARPEEATPPEPVRDVVHIKPDPGALGALATPVAASPWFIAVNALPIVAWAGAVAWRKRRERIAANPRLRRKLATRKSVAAGLDELRAAADRNDQAVFFSTVFRLLQEQIGERLNLPASAITEAVLDERLPSRGASPESIGELHELFQICNQARYAPYGGSAELNALAPRVESAIQRLQALPD